MGGVRHRLTAGFFALVRRFRRPLALALAGAVTADAVLTLAQAVRFNAPRVHGPLDAALVAAAVAAPTIATLLLWQAIRRRARI